jgi:hypothetical protein
MRSLVFGHEFTARACIPLRGAALEIAEHAEEKSFRVRPKISLFSAFSANAAVKILFEQQQTMSKYLWPS